ncbi:MFS transporter [Aquibacillus salsiterrae]|uniref:MFS transporter n=1 Tax=Aquibacillus salsiterrae TaxID=2950439 RepID=A0A9X4AE11_9BACI|nr:MFS transporter [Aquibacillus salsiterrae]MDC3415944.1 MFS transporter [Aquibacillus salsiterrae]
MDIALRLKKYGILLVALVFFTGMAGTRPLVPLLSDQLEANKAEIGLIVALFALLPFFFAIKIGQIVDRIGYKKPMIFSALFNGLALSLPFFMPSLSMVYLSQLVAGISHTVFAVSAQSSVSHSGRNREGIMIFSIGVALGSFTGPILGGIIADYFGYPVAFFVLGCFGIIAGVLASFLKEVTVTKRVEKSLNLLHSLQLLKMKNLRVAFLVSVIVLLGKDMYTAYFPLLAQQFGLTSSVIGFIVSINALGGIFIRFFMTHLSDKFSTRKIMVGSIFLSGVFMTLIPLFSSAILLALLSFVLGLGLGIGQPLSISTTVDALPEERVGEGLGLRLTANRLTQLSAPVVLGGVAQLATISSVFWVVGVVILFGGFRVKTS